MSETKANTPVSELVWNAKYRASGHGIRGEQGIRECGDPGVILKERGMFPAYRVDKYVKSGFIRTLPDDLQEAIAHHGIHNSHLIAVAPAGSISLLAGDVSSGIEPIHALHCHCHVTTAHGSAQHVAMRDYAWHPVSPVAWRRRRLSQCRKRGRQ